MKQLFARGLVFATQDMFLQDVWHQGLQCVVAVVLGGVLFLQSVMHSVCRAPIAFIVHMAQMCLGCQSSCCVGV